ncbi:hypothetical protein [Pseudoalteromonas umbrosa]|uniref:hypothetical protein n=1 Tax=Pseudoalteromonas umbrosa TaxID=3048489 RepID=UPI0024C32931|nr:hypothetical protein [Pseudoalteromonas sp. B95]MDK1290128.1 hypothetical protein [Pseudoalteromonas sp. B95]
MANALVDNGNNTTHSGRQDNAAKFAQVLGTSIKTSAESAPEAASNKQIASVVNAAGRLVQERDKINARLEQIKDAVAPSVKALGGEFKGENVTITVEDVDVKRLLPRAKISTLLIQLLGEVETQLSHEGGLFDLMLSLDDEAKSAYLIPLLDLIFEKAEMTEKAKRLYSVTSQERMYLKENA